MYFNLTEQEILNLANSSNSLTELAKHLKINPSHKNLQSLTSVLISLSYDMTSFKSKNVSSLNDPQKLEQIVKESFTYSDVLRKFKLSITGGNQNTLRFYIKKFNISVDHFNSKQFLLESKYRGKRTYEEIFCINSEASGEVAKNYILKSKLMEYKCKECGNDGSWNGKPITLQLEHINGNNRDHRIENLIFLCPNCHSQTNTYGSKNRKRKDIKSKEHISIIPVIERDIHNLFTKLPLFNNIDEVLKEYNLQTHSQTRKKFINLLERYNDEINVKEFRKKLIIPKKITYPSLEDLIKSIKEKGYSATAREIGCSDNAIRKYLKKHNIKI